MASRPRRSPAEYLIALYEDQVVFLIGGLDRLLGTPDA